MCILNIVSNVTYYPKFLSLSASEKHIVSLNLSLSIYKGQCRTHWLFGRYKTFTYVLGKYFTLIVTI